MTVRICFVCLGNICRSPTAEGVMRSQVEAAGLARAIEIDSAGTGAWHIGDLPDSRARLEASRRGIELDSLARQFSTADFEHFDLVVAMDLDNVADLHALATHDGHRQKVRLLRDFDPHAPEGAGVPDPYYGGDEGFAEVFDLVEAACAGLVEHLQREHDLA
jgi:low molecular weight protein-tyrosine phosphatase